MYFQYNNNMKLYNIYMEYNTILTWRKTKFIDSENEQKMVFYMYFQYSEADFIPYSVNRSRTKTYYFC